MSKKELKINNGDIIRISVFCRQAAREAVKRWQIDQFTADQRVNYMFRDLEAQVGKNKARKLKNKMKKQLNEIEDKK